jgi:peptidoglycan/LPS O-acetylase OafA/YrhL
VLVASFDEDYVIPPGRAKDALVWLGSRCYSVYLIHIAAWASVVEVKKRIGVPEGGPSALAMDGARLPELR